MLRLQKVKQMNRLSDNERKLLIAEINAARSVCKLLSDVLTDKIEHYEASYESLLDRPTELAGAIKCVAELKRLTKLFEETTEE